MKNQDLRSKLESCLKQMNLKAQVIRQFGQKVTFSALFDSKGTEVSAGSGNGDESELKSWAECIEHYFFLHSTFPLEERSAKQLMEQTGFRPDGVLKTLCDNQVLSTIPFESLDGLGTTVQVPLDYVSRQKLPNSEPRLRKFCSSSGYSFHQSREEALLHGLCEVTERHEFSNGLLGRQPTYQINRDSLSDHLKEEIENLERQFNGELALFTVEPQFGVWTTFFVFYPKSDEFPLPQTSQKARMDLTSSIQGSLSEMRQILSLYSEEERQEDLAVLRMPHLKNHPCLDLEGFRQKRPVPVSELRVRREGSRHIENELNFLVQTLLKKGFHPLARVIFEFENGCQVTQVFVPGFEKYNLIRLGVEVPTHQ